MEPSLGRPAPNAHSSDAPTYLSRPPSRLLVTVPIGRPRQQRGPAPARPAVPPSASPFFSSSHPPTPEPRSTSPRAATPHFVNTPAASPAPSDSHKSRRFFVHLQWAEAYRCAREGSLGCPGLNSKEANGGKGGKNVRPRLKLQTTNVAWHELYSSLLPSMFPQVINPRFSLLLAFLPSAAAPVA